MFSVSQAEFFFRFALNSMFVIEIVTNGIQSETNITLALLYICCKIIFKSHFFHVKCNAKMQYHYWYSVERKHESGEHASKNPIITPIENIFFVLEW